MDLLERMEKLAEQKDENSSLKFNFKDEKSKKQKQPKKQEKVYHGTLSTIHFLLYGREPPHETGMNKKKLTGLIIKKLDESD